MVAEASLHFMHKRSSVNARGTSRTGSLAGCRLHITPWSGETNRLPIWKFYYLKSGGLGGGRDTALLLLLNLLLVAKGNQFGILLGSLAGSNQAGNLVGQAGTLALQDNGGDQALDLGALDGRLLALLLGRDDAANDVLADVVLLAQVEELADLVGTLGSQAAGNRGVSKPGQVLVASLDDDQAEGRNVLADNAAADRLAAALTRTALAVARLALSEQQAGSSVQQDTLLHRETLLVVTTGNLHNVSLELVAERIDGNLLGHTLVVEDAQLSLVSDLDRLLAASGRVGNVELQVKLAERFKNSKMGAGWTDGLDG